MNSLLLRKMFRDMGHSLAQSLALIVVVALGVTSLVGLIGAFRDLDTSYNRTYERLHFADVTFEVESAPESVVSLVAAVEGVRSATGRLIFDSGLAIAAKGGGETQIRSRLVGIPVDRHPSVDDLLITRGDYLASTDSGVLVESHFAKAFGLAPGDRVTPYVNGRKTDLCIAGIAASPEYLIVSASRQDVIPDPKSFAVLFVPLTMLQAAY
jgi:putative ABC transport system permease protein